MGYSLRKLDARVEAAATLNKLTWLTFALGTLSLVIASVVYLAKAQTIMVSHCDLAIGVMRISSDVYTERTLIFRELALTHGELYEVSLNRNNVSNATLESQSQEVVARKQAEVRKRHTAIDVMFEQLDELQAQFDSKGVSPNVSAAFIFANDERKKVHKRVDSIELAVMQDFRYVPSMSQFLLYFTQFAQGTQDWGDLRLDVIEPFQEELQRDLTEAAEETLPQVSALAVALFVWVPVLLLLTGVVSLYERRRKLQLHAALAHSQKKIEQMLASEDIDLVRERGMTKTAEWSLTPTESASAGSSDHHPLDVGADRPAGRHPITLDDLSKSDSYSVDSTTPILAPSPAQFMIERDVRRARRVLFSIRVVFVLLSATAGILALTSASHLTERAEDLRESAYNRLVRALNLQNQIDFLQTAAFGLTVAQPADQVISGPNSNGDVDYVAMNGLFNDMRNSHRRARERVEEHAAALLDTLNAMRGETEILDVEGMVAIVDTAANTSLSQGALHLPLFEQLQTLLNQAIATNAPGPIVSDEVQNDINRVVFNETLTKEREASIASVGTVDVALINDLAHERQGDKNRLTSVSATCGVLGALMLIGIVLAFFADRRLAHVVRVQFNSSKWTLERCLADDECAELLREFISKQLCSEQLLFFEAMLATHWRVRGLSVEQASHLFETYIKSGSEQQVNLAAAMVRRVDAALQQDIKNGAEQASDATVTEFANCFAEARKLIVENSHVYFIRSDAFADFDQQRRSQLDDDVGVLAKHNAV